MSGNVWLSIGICTPINNGLSQSTACRHRVHTHSLALAHIAKFSIASDFQHSVYNSILFSSSTEYAGVLCSLVFMLRLFLVFTVRGSLLMTLHCVCQDSDTAQNTEREKPTRNELGTTEATKDAKRDKQQKETRQHFSPVYHTCQTRSPVGRIISATPPYNFNGLA